MTAPRRGSETKACSNPTSTPTSALSRQQNSSLMPCHGASRTGSRLSIQRPIARASGARVASTTAPDVRSAACTDAEERSLAAEVV
jgi:hypothetical protein